MAERKGEKCRQKGFKTKRKPDYRDCFINRELVVLFFIFRWSEDQFEAATFSFPFMSHTDALLDNRGRGDAITNLFQWLLCHYAMYVLPFPTVKRTWRNWAVPPNWLPEKVNLINRSGGPPPSPWRIHILITMLKGWTWNVCPGHNKTCQKWAWRCLDFMFVNKR